MRLLRTLTSTVFIIIACTTAIIVGGMQLGTLTEGWTVTVYASRDGIDTRIVDTRTTLVIPLLAQSTGYGEPIFSPDRRFVVRRDDGRFLLTNRATGWTYDLASGGLVSWSPDSRSLIYVQDGELQRVWVSANNARQETVDIPLQRSFGRINRIVWSPDGDNVAIEGVYRFGGETVDYEIYTLTMDDSHIVNISNDATVDDRSPVWSPDGRRLVFVSERHGNPEMYMGDLQQGGLLRLTNNPSRDSSPLWSPDGEQLAFVSYRDGEIGGGLYMLNMRDPFAPDLAGALAFGVREDTLVWSPDGHQIAFVAIVNGDTGVYVVDRDGGNLRRISDMSRLRQVMLLP